MTPEFLLADDQIRVSINSVHKMPNAGGMTNVLSDLISNKDYKDIIKAVGLDKG